MNNIPPAFGNASTTDRDQAIAEVVASMMVLLATAQRVHVEATPTFETLRSSFGQLLSLALSPHWIEDNKDRVDALLSKHMEDLESHIREAAGQATGEEAPAVS